MKILFLTPWYPDDANPNHGIFVRDQAVAISSEHEVCIVAAKINYGSFGISSLTKRESTFQSVREVRLIVKRSLPVFNQINFFFRVFCQTYLIARRFSPDVVHGNIGYPGAFWTWLVSCACGKPFVVTEHTRIINNFRSAFHRMLTLFALKRANARIAVSRTQASEMETFLGKNVFVVPNVIDFSKFKDTRPREKGTPVHIGFLGGMNTNVKGLDVLLQALSTVQQEFVLHIGGKGQLLETYKRQAVSLSIEHKCIFYGFVAHNDVSKFMSGLNFFVSASRYETFGIVMVEALACGLPVVASNSGGSKEFVNASNGMVVPVDDVVSLHNAIEKMLSEYIVYDGETIRHAILNKYAMPAFLQEINTIYHNVVKGRRK